MARAACFMPSATPRRLICWQHVNDRGCEGSRRGGLWPVHRQYLANTCFKVHLAEARAVRPAPQHATPPAAASAAAAAAPSNLASSSQSNQGGCFVVPSRALLDQPDKLGKISWPQAGAELNKHSSSGFPVTQPHLDQAVKLGKVLVLKQGLGAAQLASDACGQGGGLHATDALALQSRLHHLAMRTGSRPNAGCQPLTDPNCSVAQLSKPWHASGLVNSERMRSFKDCYTSTAAHPLLQNSPALLTMMSSPPNRSTATCTARSTSSSRLTSHSCDEIRGRMRDVHLTAWLVRVARRCKLARGARSASRSSGDQTFEEHVRRRLRLSACGPPS